MKRSKSKDINPKSSKVVKVDLTQLIPSSTSAPNATLSSSVVLSVRDKSSKLTLSDDQLICYGCDGGYRMIRATHGVHCGSYYYEVHVLKCDSNNVHYRIGWSSRSAELEGPVGYDIHSYAYRDTSGSKIHASKRMDGYGEPYTADDVIGCYIKLDEIDSSNNEIRFYKNGKDQGIAYSGSEIPPGVYFPALSIYMKGSLSINFGPTFIYKHDIRGANPLSEVQPMNPEDRKVHESRISKIKQHLFDKRKNKIP